MIAGIDVTYRYRYRVGWVVAEFDDGSVSLHEIREFRTMAGAEAYQQELASQHRVAILQVGVLVWTTPEDAQARLEQAFKSGARLI